MRVRTCPREEELLEQIACSPQPVAHLSHCEACQTRIRELGGLLSLIGELEDFRGDVPEPRPRTRWPVSAVAAALILAMGLLVLPRLTPVNDTTGQQLRGVPPPTLLRADLQRDGDNWRFAADPVSEADHYVLQIWTVTGDTSLVRQSEVPHFELSEAAFRRTGPGVVYWSMVALNGSERVAVSSIQQLRITGQLQQ